MVQRMCFVLIILMNGLIASAWTCPDPEEASSIAEENMAWKCEFDTWKNAMAEWKQRVERDCSVSADYWQSLFMCPEYSMVTCLNEHARHIEVDVFNCSVVSCTDGRYSGQYALRRSWKTYMNYYKQIMNLYEKELRFCNPRGCPETDVTTQTLDESSTASSMTTSMKYEQKTSTRIQTMAETKPVLATTETVEEASTATYSNFSSKHTLSTEDATGTTPSLTIEQVCYMGMKSGLIPDSAMTASTSWRTYFAPSYARLDSTGCWISMWTQLGQWLQVDFGSVKEVAGIITQGRPTNQNQCVSSFTISYGVAGPSTTVQEEGKDKVFPGNVDGNTRVYNRFPEVLTCRFIRINPQTWKNFKIAMRVEYVTGGCFNNSALWDRPTLSP